MHITWRSNQIWTLFSAGTRSLCSKVVARTTQTWSIVINFAGKRRSFFPVLSFQESIFDPRGRPTVMAGSDHYFRTCCLYVRPSVPTFQNLAKQNKVQAKIVISTGGTVGLAEWIISRKHFRLSLRSSKRQIESDNGKAIKAIKEIEPLL